MITHNFFTLPFGILSIWLPTEKLLGLRKTGEFINWIPIYSKIQD